MHARADQAAKEGVPLLVRVGNTKYFAVRDGQKFNRTVIGEWAHVTYKSGRNMFQCKAAETGTISLPTAKQSFSARVVSAGTPFSTWVKTLLQRLLHDLRWLDASDENHAMGSRIEDHNFHTVVLEVYFAFEALTEQVHDFVRYVHGRFPEILSVDGCAKICSDDVSTEQLLKLSMISKMVFDGRLRWVVEAAPAVSPHNRVSNVMHRTARGKFAPEGDPERGYAGELLRALGDGAISDLSSKTVDDTENMYRLRYPPGGKDISKYPTKELLIQ